MGKTGGNEMKNDAGVYSIEAQKKQKTRRQKGVKVDEEDQKEEGPRGGVPG